MNRVDIFIIEPFYRVEDFAAFALGSRLSYIVSFVSLVSTSALSGKIVKFYSDGELIKIESLRRKVFYINLAVGVVFFIFLFIFGREILQVYSSGKFFAYYDVIMLLALCQFFAGLTGVDQTILMVSGNELKLGVFSAFMTFVLFVVVLYGTYYMSVGLHFILLAMLAHSMLLTYFVKYYVKRRVLR